MAVVWIFPNVNLNCLLKPLGGSGAVADRSFSSCSRGKLSNTICRPNSIAQAGSQQGLFFPSRCFKEQSWCISTQLILWGNSVLCMCACVQMYVWRWKRCMRKGVFKKQQKKKSENPSPWETGKKCGEKGNKKCLLLFEGPLWPTKGAFWEDVYFYMFISQGNFQDEKVEQNLILPRFWANDKLHYFHIDELQLHVWLYPLDKNKEHPNSQTHPLAICRAGNASRCLYKGV